MKFLHVADLHLGRVFHERSLIDDQRAMLDSLLDALASDDFAALVIAGDVYDRSIPPPEAVTLLGSALASLRRRFPALQVLIIPGNHDSADRLGYGDRLFAELGIHIVSDAERAAEPIFVEKDGERCAFFLLPFLTPGALSPRATAENDLPILAAAAEPLRSQRDLAAEAASRLEEARKKAMDAGAAAAVLVAHLFASGGAESESERVFLGTAERVDIGRFAAFDYVALGHLHRPQAVAPNAWYAGSPLAYSFDEAGREKVFLSVGVGRDAADGKPAVAMVPVAPLRRLRRLAGPFDSFLEPRSYADAREDYLEIALEDIRLTENPLALLRDRFPYLLSVKQDAALAAARAAAGAAGPARSPAEGRRGAAEDFEAFLADLYGAPDEAEVELFRTIAREVDDATA